jgi:sugar lactone lactonase YvrE
VVFTEGVPSTTLTNPDFTLVSSGTTCTGVVTGSCTVNVKFTPQFAGLRRGAVKLVDSHNNVVATAYISGVGANSQTPFMPGTLQTLQAYGAVSGVAVDGAGDVFFIAGSGVVYKLTGGKAISVPLGTTLNSASGLALDGAGNLYIADSGNYRVLELPYGSSSALALPITGPLVYPQGIVVDGSGNIFIANTRATVAQGNGTVIELAAGSNAQTTVIANGLNLPVGLAVDASGDLFVADWGNNRVLEVGASGAWTSIGTGLSNVSGVAVDGSGDVFILDQNHNQLVEVPGTTSGPGTGVQTTVATGLSQPNGIALDGQGDLFLSNLGTAASPGSLVEVPNR